MYLKFFDPPQQGGRQSGQVPKVRQSGDFTDDMIVRPPSPQSKQLGLEGNTAS